MSLSQYKIREIEFLASGLKLEPDTLVEALISLGFKEPKQKEIVEEVKKLTPEEKVKAIEEEALNKGWTYKQLWATTNNSDLSKKGLIYFVESNTTIGEVKEELITLIHERPVGGSVIHILENKYSKKRPWIKKVTTEENKGVYQ